MFVCIISVLLLIKHMCVVNSPPLPIHDEIEREPWIAASFGGTISFAAAAIYCIVPASVEVFVGLVNRHALLGRSNHPKIPNTYI